MRCKLDRVRFKGTDGFSVFSYHTQDPDTPESARHFSRLGKSWYTFTAVGYGMPDTDAVDVELDGKWENSKYGLQLHVSSCREVAPRTVKSILAYLCSGLIKGIGPETAKAIVAKFGTQTIDVLENEPERLLEVKGIAKAKLATIMRSYEQTRTLREITEYLSPFGVSLKKIHKIQEAFGDDSLRIVKTDPFQLCKIKGFGFLTVDEIARKTRVSLRHPLRYVGAMLYLLDEAMGAGHLFLPVEELESKCYDLLNRDCQREVVSVSDIHAAVVKAHMDKLIYNEKGRVYKFFERQCEVQVAKRVVSLLLQERPIEIPNITAEIKASEKALHQQLAPSQRTAVELCLTHSISIITGGPGVGKTTTLRVILDIYHRVMPDNEILLAAPTGKASRRMHEQTGYPASTLHSAMGIMYDADLAAQEYELLTADLVIVDECSMVDMRLAYALFQRLKPGAQLILVGDPDQLPSVGPGNVLREMIRSQMIPTAVLDIVFRQASNSRIALNAHAVNHNDTHLLYGDDFIFCDVNTSDEALSLILKYYVQEVSQNGIENVQILSPQRKKGTVCANRLNSEIRDLVNPPRAGRAEIKCGGMTYRVGDRVIQTRNQEEVANGEVGVITAITGDGTNDPVIEITLLDGRVLNYSADMLEDVDLSYCISIHKSQGAEFPVVLIPILKEHYIMLRRNLLYTAISRAKSKVILIGQRQAIYMAIHKHDVDKRNTALADRITVYYDREQQRPAS